MGIQKMKLKEREKTLKVCTRSHLHHQSIIRATFVDRHLRRLFS